MDVLGEVRRRLEAISDRRRHRSDIVAYAREKHGVWLWRRQREACRAITTKPGWAMVESANAVGKTHLMGMCIAWFHDCFDPGIGVVTAPNFDQIRRTTFKEARQFLRGRKGLLPKNPSIYDHERHYFDGFTADGATGFQGIHEEAVMILFEEATAIAKGFWTAARSMIAGGENIYFIASLNPTDPTSAAREESQLRPWTVIRISALEHPNVLAGLVGRAEPIPGAVSLGWNPNGDHTGLIGNMVSWGERGRPFSDERTSDLDVDLWDPATYGFTGPEDRIDIHPDGTTVTPEQVVEGARKYFPGRYWRPGPDGEARILGRYPAQSTYAIFAEALLDRAYAGHEELPDLRGLVLGCDVARYGDDTTAIHGRVRNVSCLHEENTKQSTTETANRLKAICKEKAPLAGCKPWEIPVLIDDTGVGGGVVDQAGSTETMEDGSEAEVRYNFVPVNSSCVARNQERHDKVRSEILFDLAERVGKGEARFCLLPRATFDRIRLQATQIHYKLDNKGRRVAEPKADGKKRLGRSPDDLDAVGLAYYDPPVSYLRASPPPEETPHRRMEERPRSESRDRYFGPREPQDDWRSRR